MPYTKDDKYRAFCHKEVPSPPSSFASILSPLSLSPTLALITTTVQRDYTFLSLPQDTSLCSLPTYTAAD